MANKNVISSKKMMDVVRANKKEYGVTTVDWNGMRVIIKRLIPLDDMVSMVENVVNSCFQGPENIFMPQYMDFAIRSNVIDLYTNIALPDNYDDQYEIAYGTDIVETILANIDSSQFKDILRSINHKVDKKIDERVSMVDIGLSEAISKVNAIAEEVSKLFGDVTNEDIKKVVSAITSGKIDEQKLMAAYTDAHKKAVEDGKSE